MRKSTPDPTEIGSRIYCGGCDSFRPRELFLTGTGKFENTCSHCRSRKTVKYYQKQHDEAVAALGNACMKCGTEYVPKKTPLYMLRLPGYPFGDSQYARDKQIIADPETAKRFIRMVCKKHRPVFQSVTSTTE